MVRRDESSSDGGGGPKAELMIRKADGTLVSPRGRDPDDYLSPEAEALYWRGIPQSTQDIYTYQWLRFTDWCSKQPSPRAHMPARPATLIEYIHAHTNWTKTDADGNRRFPGVNGQPYAPETVKLALKVISVAHAGFGFVSPTKERGVRSTWRRYRDEWEAKGYKRAVAHTLTPDQVLALVATCDLTTVAGIRDCLLMRLAFDCGRRNQEFCSIDWHDVKWLDDRRLTIRFRFSKVKRDDGADEVGFESDDIWAPDTDPVRMALEYRELAASRGCDVQKGPLFTEVRMGKRRKVGISGVFVPGQRMTRRAFQDMVTMRAEVAGIDIDPVSKDHLRIRPHSFRHAFASEADRDGVPLHLTNKRAGWAADSLMSLRYANTAAKWGDDNPGVMIRRAAVERREAEEARLRNER